MFWQMSFLIKVFLDIEEIFDMTANVSVISNIKFTQSINPNSEKLFEFENRKKLGKMDPKIDLSFTRFLISSSLFSKLIMKIEAINTFINNLEA